MVSLRTFATDTLSTCQTRTDVAAAQLRGESQRACALRALSPPGIPAPPVSISLIWTYADPGGKPADGVARDVIVQLCEFSLHPDDFERVLAGESL
jgi:hypothetical protein